MIAEQATDPVAFHAEGPVWSARWQGLRWVDMLAGAVMSLAADGTISRRHVGSVAAAVRPRTRGGAVIGVERGFVLEEPDGTLTALNDVWDDDRGCASSPADLRTRPQGHRVRDRRRVVRLGRVATNPRRQTARTTRWHLQRRARRGGAADRDWHRALPASECPGCLLRCVIPCLDAAPPRSPRTCAPPATPRRTVGSKPDGASCPSGAAPPGMTSYEARSTHSDPGGERTNPSDDPGSVTWPTTKPHGPTTR